jgi:hypothetical protein
MYTFRLSDAILTRPKVEPSEENREASDNTAPRIIDASGRRGPLREFRLDMGTEVELAMRWTATIIDLQTKSGLYVQ